METGRRFRYMFSSLGWTVADVAKFLQVSRRTVQLWCSGRVRVPHAAYKLLRLQLRYELPGEAWEGWTLTAGRLYTPEGRELNPRDFSWWSLLVRKAAMFQILYDQRAMAGRVLPGPAGMALGATRLAAAAHAPTSAAGRPAQPAGLDLSLGHFGTGKAKSECLRGFQRIQWSGLLAGRFPRCEKGGSHGYTR